MFLKKKVNAKNTWSVSDPAVPDDGTEVEAAKPAAETDACDRAKGSRASFGRGILLADIALAISACTIDWWIDSVQPNMFEPDLKEWDARVRMMPPWEAELVHLQLQALIARESSTSPFGIGGDDANALLARFYLDRGKDSIAKTALEKSVRTFSMATSATKWDFSDSSKWRWITLLQLYLNDGQFDKASATADGMKTIFHGLEAASTDSLEFHNLARQAYSGCGQTSKASQEQHLIAITRWLPRHSEVYAEWMPSISAFREQTFEYAIARLAHGEDVEALKTLKSLASDKLALAQRVDSPNLLAAARMMIPVAEVKAKRWTEAERSFPRALRLAGQQQQLADITYDARPPFFEAYADFLDHQGNAAEALKFRQKAQTALYTPEIRSDHYSVFSEPGTHFDPRDLYADDDPLDRHHAGARVAVLLCRTANECLVRPLVCSHLPQQARLAWSERAALPEIVRSAYGDRVQFHRMASEVYGKAGWTEKASQEKRQSDLK